MFKSWCRRQGFCNGSNLSHVLMDGGILSVPFDKLNEFYEMYIKAVQSGEKIYVVAFLISLFDKNKPIIIKIAPIK